MDPYCTRLWAGNSVAVCTVRAGRAILVETKGEDRMARAHLEFIQAQVLPWITLPETAARPGVGCKVLSKDADSGAVSVLLQYPAGFAIDGAHYLDNDEEFFVLDGAIEIGERTYGPHAYAYLPNGYPRDGMRAPDGATVLTFFEGPHQNVFGKTADYDQSRLVEHIDVAGSEWGDGVDPKVVGAGLSKLLLRLDKKTGERTWVLKMGATDPSIAAAPLETHPHVEELFLLDGAISMPQGVLRRGAYFWRPGGIQHGPIGTKPGCTCFFRCKEGPFSTDWTDKAETIVWDAPYRPTLPDALAQYGGEEYGGKEPY